MRYESKNEKKKLKINITNEIIDIQAELDGLNDTLDWFNESLKTDDLTVKRLRRWNYAMTKFWYMLNDVDDEMISVWTESETNINDYGELKKDD